MKNYREASERLGSRDSRKLENNTYLKRFPSGDIVVRLHNTDIVTFKPDGDIVLNSGGWRTVTTKDRLNKFSPVTIAQERGVWYVGIRSNPYGDWERFKREAKIFNDGMVIKADGKFEGAENPTPKANKKLLSKKKQISKYVDGYLAALDAGKVPAPSHGDCWFCMMRVGAGDTKTGVLNANGELTKQATVGFGFKGTTLGEQQGSVDHLEAHIKEKYYVPSLLARAIEVIPVSVAARDWYLASFWDKSAPDDLKDRARSAGRSIGQEQLKRSLRRYLQRQFGFAN